MAAPVSYNKHKQSRWNDYKYSYIKADLASVMQDSVEPELTSVSKSQVTWDQKFDNGRFIVRLANVSDGLNFEEVPKTDLRIVRRKLDNIGYTCEVADDSAVIYVTGYM